MCRVCISCLVKMRGNALFGVLEVFYCVEFAREKFRNVEDTEGDALGYEAQESQLVERVFEVLLVHHAVQLLVESSSVSLAHSLDAKALASSRGWVAGLAYLGDGTIFVHYNLHLLFAKFVTNQGENILMAVFENPFYDLSVVEKVAVQQQNLFPFCLGACQPEGIDVVGCLVILVVDEANADAVAVGFLHKVFDFLVQIARYDDELADTGLDDGIHGTLQQSAFAYLEQALWRVESERAKARSGARSKDNCLHLLKTAFDGVNNGLYLLTASEGDAQAIFQTFVCHELNFVVL